MKIKVLKEAGYEEAMLGLSLSYNADPSRMPARAMKLAHKDGGHNKFLESIAVWLDIKAPRYWWQEWDTYRVGMTKQSESTVHTGLKNELWMHHFSDKTDHRIVLILEEIRRECVKSGDVERFKANLPEGFLQRRQITTNYKTIRHIVAQRHDHKLPEWQVFCDALRGLEHRHFIFGGEV